MRSVSLVEGMKMRGTRQDVVTCLIRLFTIGLSHDSAELTEATKAASNRPAVGSPDVA